jgi:hypothetical protein
LGDAVTEWITSESYTWAIDTAVEADGLPDI